MGGDFHHLHVLWKGEDPEKLSDLINDFEGSVGYCLPKTYRNLKLNYNNALFAENEFDFITKTGEKDGRSIHFFSLGPEGSVSEPVEREQVYVSDPLYYGVPGLVAFASTAEGDTVCFDYRDDPDGCDPKVILLVHDEYEEEPDGSVHMKIEPIADNFDAFLDMLYEYKEEND